jgi:hypothetical protein
MVGEGDLLLTESTATSCEKAGCPWLEGKLCKLSGQVMMRMNIANVKLQGMLPCEPNGVSFSKPETDWIEQNGKRFLSFSSGCVLSSLNRSQLLNGHIPSPLILTAGDPEQYDDNVKFAKEQEYQLLKVQPNAASWSVLVSPIFYSHDVR